NRLDQDDRKRRIQTPCWTLSAGKEIALRIEHMFDTMGPMPPAPGYAELHAWSNFTFLEGGSHPEELVGAAVAAGLAGIALTDRDGLYGAVRFAKAAKEQK